MLMHERRAKPDDSVPTSSMADIAFLLLIFFLVTTVFPRDQGLALHLPRPEESLDVSPRNLLLFSIGADGRVEVRKGTDERGVTIDPTRVADTWRTHVADNPLLIAVVQTHVDSHYGAMVTVLDGLKVGRADRISLQTLEEGR